MVDIGEFLLARIAEDEAAAVPGAVPNWGSDGNSVVWPREAPRGWVARDVANDVAAKHIARWDPARVLAECEAKRRIVKFYAGPVGQMYVLRFLAEPYADHADYQPEWSAEYVHVPV